MFIYTVGYLAVYYAGIIIIVCVCICVYLFLCLSVCVYVRACMRACVCVDTPGSLAVLLVLAEGVCSSCSDHSISIPFATGGRSFTSQTFVRPPTTKVLLMRT